MRMLRAARTWDDGNAVVEVLGVKELMDDVVGAFLVAVPDLRTTIVQCARFCHQTSQQPRRGSNSLIDQADAVALPLYSLPLPCAIER